MISHYIEIISRAFEAIWLFRISALILFLFTILVLILVVIIILLDRAYRPSIPQYPFNLFLDRIIPITAIFLPSCLILFLCPTSIAWIQRFFLLILVHCFILIPLFHYWSNLRSWNNVDNEQLTYISWNNPILYKHITIAIIYPAFWGLYLSFSWYIRLGSSIDIFSLITSINPSWIIILFIYPFISVWLKFILWSLLDIRYYLWSSLSSLYYSIHLKILQHKLYF